MRGISPLVASVLLIGVTMTIAGALAFWASSFVTGKIETTKNTTQFFEKCAAANFGIYSYFYNSATKSLTLLLENRANVQLAITGINFIYPNGTVDFKNISLTLSVGGALSSYTVTDVEPGYQKFRVLSECPNMLRES
jgi:flagellin-like protein